LLLSLLVLCWCCFSLAMSASSPDIDQAEVAGGNGREFDGSGGGGGGGAAAGGGEDEPGGDTHTPAPSETAALLATGGYDHTIRLWSPDTGACHRTLQHSDSQVNGLEITPDRAHIAVAGHSQIRFYDVNSSSPSAVSGLGAFSSFSLSHTHAHSLFPTLARTTYTHIHAHRPLFSPFPSLPSPRSHAPPTPPAPHPRPASRPAPLAPPPLTPPARCPRRPAPRPHPLTLARTLARTHARTGVEL
jgi:hypothetical protein